MTDTFLLLHGINLNWLGRRDPCHYGTVTLADLEAVVTAEAAFQGCGVRTFQSNHEGSLTEYLQQNAADCAGIIINPGAWAHYSYALHDALLDTGLPAVEVHLSPISQREPWRKISVTAAACIALIEGQGAAGYRDAVRLLANRLRQG